MFGTFGSEYGMGPLASDSFTAGLGDIENAFLQQNVQGGLPGMSEEQDETQLAETVGDESGAMDNFQKVLGALGRSDSMAGNMANVARLFMGAF